MNLLTKIKVISDSFRTQFDVYIYIYIYIYMIDSFRPDRLNETQFLPSRGCIDTAVWMHCMDANKTAGEKARRQLHKNAASNTEQVLEATPHKVPTTRPLTSHHENYPS